MSNGLGYEQRGTAEQLRDQADRVPEPERRGVAPATLGSRQIPAAVPSERVSKPLTSSAARSTGPGMWQIHVESSASFTDRQSNVRYLRRKRPPRQPRSPLGGGSTLLESARPEDDSARRTPPAKVRRATGDERDE